MRSTADGRSGRRRAARLTLWRGWAPLTGQLGGVSPAFEEWSIAWGWREGCAHASRVNSSFFRSSWFLRDTHALHRRDGSHPADNCEHSHWPEEGLTDYNQRRSIGCWVFHHHSGAMWHVLRHNWQSAGLHFVDQMSKQRVVCSTIQTYKRLRRSLSLPHHTTTQTTDTTSTSTSTSTPTSFHATTYQLPPQPHNVRHVRLLRKPRQLQLLRRELSLPSPALLPPAARS
jgi:hypothetical protein